jgi:hypothetical protein
MKTRVGTIVLALALGAGGVAMSVAPANASTVAPATQAAAAVVARSAVHSASPNALTTTISPDFTITTSYYCTANGTNSNGYYCSYNDNHQNTNNVTIRWSGNSTHEGIWISLTTSSGYFCWTGQSSVTSLSHTCTGVPKGTVQVFMEKSTTSGVTMSDSYTG